MCLEVRHLPAHLPPHDVTNLHSLVIKKTWQYVQMCVSLSLYVFLESFSFGSFFFLLFDCFVLLSSFFILANLLLLLYYYYYYYYRYMFVSKINTQTQSSFCRANDWSWTEHSGKQCCLPERAGGKFHF